MTITHTITFNNNKITKEHWKLNNLSHSHKDIPAIIKYRSNGKIKTLQWYKHGIQHRNKGPSTIIYMINGQVVKTWYKNGIIKKSIMYDINNKKIYKEYY